MGIAVTKFYINKIYPVDADFRLSEFLFFLYSTLKEAGWRSVADSDGTTRSGTGNQLTHGGPGANGMKNANAWWILRQPVGGTPPYSGNRTITIRRNSDANYSMWYSYSGNLTTIGNATTPDTAADTQLVNTAGVGSTDMNSRIAIAVCDAAENFGWWCFSWRENRVNSSGTFCSMFFDPCRRPHPSDPDPYVMASKGSFGWIPTIDSISERGTEYWVHQRCWYNYGTPEAYWGAVSGLHHSLNTRTYPKAGGLSQIKKEHLCHPIFWQRGNINATPVIPTYKGISTLFRWLGRKIGHGTPFKVNGTVRYMGTHDILARWETRPNVKVIA